MRRSGFYCFCSACHLAEPALLFLNGPILEYCYRLDAHSSISWGELARIGPIFYCRFLASVFFCCPFISAARLEVGAVARRGSAMVPHLRKPRCCWLRPGHGLRTRAAHWLIGGAIRPSGMIGMVHRRLSARALRFGGRGDLSRRRRCHCAVFCHDL